MVLMVSSSYCLTKYLNPGRFLQKKPKKTQKNPGLQKQKPRQASTLGDNRQ